MKSRLRTDRTSRQPMQHLRVSASLLNSEANAQSHSFLSNSLSNTGKQPSKQSISQNSNMMMQRPSTNQMINQPPINQLPPRPPSGPSMQRNRTNNANNNNNNNNNNTILQPDDILPLQTSFSNHVALNTTNTSQYPASPMFHPLVDSNELLEGFSPSSVKNISVTVRLRPLNQREITLIEAEKAEKQRMSVDRTNNRANTTANDTQELIYDATTVSTIGSKPRSFLFDAVIPSSISQDNIFTNRIQPLINACYTGYNACIFAYGQTGSGKTFTMSGPDLFETAASQESIERLQQSESRGIIPRTLQHIFHLTTQGNMKKNVNSSSIVPSFDFNSDVNLGSQNRDTQEQNDDIEQDVSWNYTVSCTFLEVYNEKIIDLLLGVTPLNSSNLASSTTPTTISTVTAVKDLVIREAVTGETFVEGLTTIPIDSADQALGLLLQGTTRRKVASTKMNQTSSRSHSVFGIILTATNTLGQTRVSKLNLVDLAGSECAQMTGATGMQQTEASNINRSLTTLGSVMMILAKNSELSKDKKPTFVPYRDSKLTHLLKESIGGNSKLCLIANISPSPTNIQETVSTLTFASNARKLKKRVNSTALNGGSNTNSIKIERMDPLELLSVAIGDDSTLVDTIHSQRRDLQTRFTQLKRLASMVESMKQNRQESQNKTRKYNHNRDDEIINNNDKYNDNRSTNTQQVELHLDRNYNHYQHDEYNNFNNENAISTEAFL